MGEDARDEPWLCPPELVEFAEAVRQEHHTKLDGARIRYVFIPKGPRKGGWVRMGQAKKQSALNALLTDADFIIILSHDVWKELSPKQRRALLDHELCHCAQKLEDEQGGGGNHDNGG